MLAMPSNAPSLGGVDVTVIGGGAASAMLLMQWKRQNRWPGRVLWCESTAEFGLGAAYRTHHPRHLLNVMSSRMGCFAETPEDFLHWVEHSDTVDAVTARADHSVPLSEAYLPRRLYGQYLQARLHEHLHDADLQQHPHAIRSITPATQGGYILHSEAGAWHSNHIVLAMGNQPNPRWDAAVQQSPQWIGNIWQPQMRTLPADTGAPLLIIGAGLSAVDTVFSLRDGGWAGEILLASRHGHWPHPHLLGHHTAYTHTREDLFGKRPAGLLQHLRALVRNGVEWRSVVDGLRPHTIALWKSWSVADQARFLKRLWPWWNIHRHRMAPPAMHWLDAALPGTQRQPLAAAVRQIYATSQGLEAMLHGRGVLHPAAIADCTGPSLSILTNPGPLQGLLDEGLLLPAANGAGIETDAQHAVYAGAHGCILALGTLTLGMRLETTAIPELRTQAAELAAHPLPL